MPQICRNGRCVNTLEGYHCECDEGFVYEPTMHACDDVDECETNNGRCDINADCLNTVVCIPSNYSSIGY